MEKNQIHNRLAQAGIDLKNKTILLAISGGADSMACAHFFVENQKNFSIRQIVAAHVNHGLRGHESDADAQLVADFCSVYKIELITHSLKGSQYTGESLENWCREQRYNFFSNTMQNRCIDFCITAHTLNDLAESFLMKIERGVGPTGLEAIHIARESRWLRPLLHISRPEIMQYIASHAISFREDSSNTDQRFRRNYIRHTVLPSVIEQHPHFLNQVLSITDKARILKPALHRFINNEFHTAISEKQQDYFILDTIQLRSFATEPLNKDLLFIFLDALWKEYSIPQLDSSLFDTIFSYLSISAKGTSPLKTALKQGWHIHANSSHFLVHHSLNIQQFTIPFTHSSPCTFTLNQVEYTLTTEILTKEQYHLTDSTSRFEVYMDANKIPASATIRNKSTKDVFSPLGICSKGRKLITFLNDKKVLKELHHTIPLLAHNNDILWVIGYQISDNCKIDETTHRIMKMSVTCKTTK